MIAESNHSWKYIEWLRGHINDQNIYVGPYGGWIELNSRGITYNRFGLTKKGTISKRESDVHFCELTILRRCKLCEKYSTPKKIQDRSIHSMKCNYPKKLHENHKGLSISHPALCMSCYNKVRPLISIYTDYMMLALICYRIKVGNYDISKFKDCEMTNRTTADLRATLFDVMDGVKDGSIGVNEGKTIAVIADKIVDTARLELDYSQTLSKLDRDDQDITTGPIMLTSDNSH